MGEGFSSIDCNFADSVHTTSCKALGVKDWPDSRKPPQEFEASVADIPRSGVQYREVSRLASPPEWPLNNLASEAVEWLVCTSPTKEMVENDSRQLKY